MPRGRCSIYGPWLPCHHRCLRVLAAKRSARIVVRFRWQVGTDAIRPVYTNSRTSRLGGTFRRRTSKSGSRSRLTRLPRRSVLGVAGPRNSPWLRVCLSKARIHNLGLLHPGRAHTLSDRASSLQSVVDCERAQGRINATDRERGTASAAPFLAVRQAATANVVHRRVQSVSRFRSGDRKRNRLCREESSGRGPTSPALEFCATFCRSGEWLDDISRRLGEGSSLGLSTCASGYGLNECTPKKKERAARERDTRAALSRREGNQAGIQVATLPNRNRDGRPPAGGHNCELIGLLATCWNWRFHRPADRQPRR